ncbi:metal-dependent transcriptional regulator [Kribbella sandramycini]|uniref:Manganese transport regulator n=1 Tax=Kribbella sandramycini TaxID=60450 RepID=A0A7Y4L8A5_9ACTN|nr:metal-dependent transcriptional regulator [Kribbella sandramycini]NOL45176.1 metal-dependent transcriptional regulator [Kribbella sandramycini]
MTGRRAVAETQVTENYLKVVWNAREWSDGPVTVGVLAARLGLAPSSVSGAVRKLTERGLLTHARYGDIELTDQGQRLALATVRKHRLIETFLVEYLGYTWDEVHDEAEILEHAVSDTFTERLAAKLGEPDHDPHGDPIPRADGTLAAADHPALDTIEPGRTVRVARVSDEDPDLLRHLAELGLTIGTALHVHRRQDAIGTIDVDYNGACHILGLPAARSIRVTAN